MSTQEVLFGLSFPVHYLKDEHPAKKKCPLPDIDGQELVGSTLATPKQCNGKFHVLITWEFKTFSSIDFCYQKAMAVAYLRVVYVH